MSPQPERITGPEGGAPDAEARDILRYYRELGMAAKLARTEAIADLTFDDGEGAVLPLPAATEAVDLVIAELWGSKGSTAKARRAESASAAAAVVRGSTERRERSRARAETAATQRFGEPAFARIEGRLLLALIRRHGRMFPVCRPGYSALKREVGAGVAAIDAAANRLVGGGYLNVETPPRASAQWRKSAWRKRKRYTVRAVSSWGPLP